MSPFSFTFLFFSIFISQSSAISQDSNRLNLKVLVAGKGSPGFVLGEHDDSDDNPICVHFLRSFETPSEAKTCNSAVQVANSERRLTEATWKLQPPATLFSTSKSQTGADRIGISFTRTDDDSFAYSLQLQNYTFVNSLANYVLELSFGLCDRTLFQAMTLPSDSSILPKHNTTSRHHKSPNTNSTSQETLKSHLTSASYSNSTSQESKAKRESESSDKTTSSSSSSSSKDTSSSASTSTSQSKASASASGERVKERADQAIRRFMRSTQTVGVCQGKRRVVKSVTCSSVQFNLYRVILPNFGGCHIEQSQSRGLDVRKVAGLRDSDDNAAVNGKGSYVPTLAVLFALCTFI